MKMNRKVRMIIGVVALVIIIAIIVIIAINSGKSARENTDADPTATLPPVTDTVKPDDEDTEATPTVEPDASEDPATDGNLGEELPSTETNLPSEELINELIEEAEKQNSENQ